ncbi:hypothetical protein B0T24DRAFT_169101 [Lasiosphaeria ovina]|uniref:Uncharacterized protein n=1 Tax=Lasiosphaeria ovina TaxID=92902 RepID=A0AAE0NE16_9PEZI|nr:hypothetical protein B0T24DRAFT_169101 [Lasiosphaeria ovina]
MHTRAKHRIHPTHHTHTRSSGFIPPPTKPSCYCNCLTSIFFDIGYVLWQTIRPPLGHLLLVECELEISLLSCLYVHTAAASTTLETLPVLSCHSKTKNRQMSSRSTQRAYPKATRDMCRPRRTTDSRAITSPLTPSGYRLITISPWSGPQGENKMKIEKTLKDIKYKYKKKSKALPERECFHHSFWFLLPISTHPAIANSSIHSTLPRFFKDFPISMCPFP